jgi:hypothetical protein
MIVPEVFQRSPLKTRKKKKPAKASSKTKLINKKKKVKKT